MQNLNIIISDKLTELDGLMAEEIKFDCFGATIEIGSRVIWKYNYAVTGGSKPFLAIGDVVHLSKKQARINMLWFHPGTGSNQSWAVDDIKQTALNQEVRAAIDCLVVIDSNPEHGTLLERFAEHLEG